MYFYIKLFVCTFLFNEPIKLFCLQLNQIEIDLRQVYSI